MTMTGHAARARFLLQFCAPSGPHTHSAHQRLSDFWRFFLVGAVCGARAAQLTGRRPQGGSFSALSVLWQLQGEGEEGEGGVTVAGEAAAVPVCLVFRCVLRGRSDRQLLPESSGRCC